MLDSLNESGKMDGFRLAKPNTYMVFLGDYTDRGNYGIEVLYTMLRLKLANPEQVFMARGNHEDIQMIASYGFLAECQKKYGTQFSPGLIARLYDFFRLSSTPAADRITYNATMAAWSLGICPGTCSSPGRPLRFSY